MWFQPVAGPARHVVPAFATYLVSPDSGTLVVTGVEGKGVVAYRLPSFQAIRDRDVFGSGRGAVVVAIRGDRVWLRQAAASAGPGLAAVWDLGTGALHDTAFPVSLWAVSRDGSALRATYETDGSTRACVDVLPAGSAITDSRTGTCGELVRAVERATISPDGQWVALNGPGLRLVRTDEIRSGHWGEPVVPPGGRWDLHLWDSDTSFIVTPGTGNPLDHVRLFRCVLGGECRPLVMPSAVDGTSPLQEAVVMPPG